MEITSESVEPRQVKLTLQVADKLLDAARKEVVREISQRHKVPGYRPGKAPLARVAAIVGEDTIEQETLERASRKAVDKAVRQQELRPSAPVSVSQVAEEPLTLEATVPLAPKVELGDYTALRFDIPDPEPLDPGVVEETLERWRRDLAFLEPAADAAQEGDVLRLSLVGRMDDETVFEDEALAMVLDRDKSAESNLPPQVVDELIGLDEGEDAEFEVTYSELWPQPELQGRTVRFEAHVESVSRLQLPELDDDLAQQMADVETLDELREKVREQLESRAAMDAREEHAEQLVNALAEHATLEYPPQMLELEVSDVLNDLRQRVERQGFRWERWLELNKDNEEQLLTEARERAQARLERSLVMTAFVEAEGLRITRDEVDQEVQAFTERLDKGARRNLPSREELRRSLGTRMLTQRALARLMAIVAGDIDNANEEPSDDDAPEDAGAEASTRAADEPETTPA